MLIRLRATIRYYIGAIIVIRRTKSNSKYEYSPYYIFCWSLSSFDSKFFSWKLDLIYICNTWMVLNKFRDRKKIFCIDEMTTDNMTEEMVFAYTCFWSTLLNYHCSLIFLIHVPWILCMFKTYSLVFLSRVQILKNYTLCMLLAESPLHNK